MNTVDEGVKVSSPVFTVFTPTYNRGSVLHRVYESLCAQTFRDFEWLIVDDGSTDDTPVRVGQWKQAASFPIRYFVQENRGKHFAFNRGVQEARGRFFLTLDSDDACTPEALERFLFHWNSIPADQREAFSAVTALCRDQHGRPVGSRFPQDVLDSDSLEIRYRYHVTGEKWGFQRTDVLRQFPFPEALEGQYLPEGVVWSRIARRYKTRFVNEFLRIYYIEEGSLVHGHAPQRHAAGGRLQHQTVLNDEIAFFRFAPREFLRSAVHYVRFSNHLGVGLSGQVRDLSNRLAKTLWLLAVLPGLVVYHLDRNRYWRILREQRRPAKFLMSRVLMRSGLCRFFTIQQDGFRLRFHPTSISAALWIDPHDRQAEARFFQAFLRPGDTVIDVGANVGTTALTAAVLVGPQGQVVAVEPHPQVFRYLQENIHRNEASHVTLHNVALGSEERIARLSNQSADDQNRMGDANGVEVQETTLDRLTQNLASIALLKIDVEGYEKFVLEGASQTLSKTECVYFEASEENFRHYGYTTPDVLTLLKRQGFSVFQWKGGALIPVPEGYRAQRLENLIAARNGEWLQTRMQDSKSRSGVSIT